MTTSPTTKTTEIICIDKLVYEGWGLARLKSGQVVFVEKVAPGDEIEVELPQEPSKKPLFIKNYKIVKKSPDRIEPICSVFENCGGCHWQQIDYQNQLKSKQAILLETFKRAGLDIVQIEINSIIPSPDSTQYRTTVQLQIKDNQVGYYQSESNTLCQFEQCQVIPDDANRIAELIQSQLNSLNLIGLERVVYKSNHDQSEVLIQFILEQLDEEDVEPLTKLANFLGSELKTITGISAVDALDNKLELYGTDQIKTIIDGQEFSLSSQTFFQINQQILPSLFAWLKPLVKQPLESILDLYGGVGLFAKLLGQDAKSVSLIEDNTASATCAMLNLGPWMGEKKIQVFSKPVQEYLETHNKNYDVIILDPPRKGCSKRVLDWCTNHVNHQLIYISCNPTTLVRDLKLLNEMGAWQIRAIQAFDFFPQTYHFETVVILDPL